MRIGAVFIWLVMAIGLTSTSNGRIYPVALQGYVVSEKQLLKAGDFYAGYDPMPFEQFSFEYLKQEPSFIVVFAKNQGQALVSGIIKATIGSRSFELPVLEMPRDMSEFTVWVIPVGSAKLGEGKELPRIQFEWKEFHTDAL